MPTSGARALPSAGEAAAVRLRRETAQNVRRTKEGELESHDFEGVLSPVIEAQLRSRTKWDLAVTSAWRWMLLTLIGLAVALLAVLIIASTRFLQRLKFSIVYGLIDRERTNELGAGIAFLAFLSLCIAYALAAALPVVFLEPSAAGSGIPEVITVLNGVKMPTTLRLKTLACKVFGVVFAVASGLPAGYEGPMVAIGASVGAGMSQGKSTTLGIDTRWSVFRSFRRDAAKRDFITCGAGAGIASAFNSPIGGVLFALEEGASYWKKSLAWRCLWATMIAAFTLDFLLSGLTQYINWATGDTEDDAAATSSWGVLSGDAMLSLGSFSATGQTSLTWGAWELPLFIGLGAVAGVAGALFNSANASITKWRIGRTAGAAALAAAAAAAKASHDSAAAAAAGASGSTSAAGDASAPLLGGEDAEQEHLHHQHQLPPLQQQQQHPRPDGYTQLGDRVVGAPAPSPSPASSSAPHAGMRLLEVIGVTTLVAVVAFLAPVLLGSCVPLPPASSAAANRYSGAFVTLYCPSGSFNPLASLWLAPQEEAIRFLLHFSNTANATGGGNVTHVGGGGSRRFLMDSEFDGPRGGSARRRNAQPRAAAAGGGASSSAPAGGSRRLRALRAVGRAVAATQRFLNGGSSGVSSLLPSMGAPAMDPAVAAWYAGQRQLQQEQAAAGSDGTYPQPQAYGATGDGATTESASFSPSQLAFFFVAYTALMCVTSGIALPSGLFIPTLLAGSAIGRLLGEGINRLSPSDAWDVDPGTYALIGAAAMLAGVTRMSVALAAIMLESSGNFSLSLPLALTIMSARAVGNMFNLGIYDTQIHLRRLPILNSSVDPAIAYELRACDVMRHPPLVFSEVETVGRVYDVLLSTPHHGFPVVFSEAMARAHPRLGSLAGFVQRRHLAVILAAHAFHAAPPKALSELQLAPLPSAGSNNALALLGDGAGGVDGGGDDEGSGGGRKGGGGDSARRGSFNHVALRYGRNTRAGSGVKASPTRNGGGAGLGIDFEGADGHDDGDASTVGDGDAAGDDDGAEAGAAAAAASTARGGAGAAAHHVVAPTPGRRRVASSGKHLVRLMTPTFGAANGAGGGGGGNATAAATGGNVGMASRASFSGVGGGGLLLSPGGRGGNGKPPPTDVRLRIPSVSSSHELFALGGGGAGGAGAAGDASGGETDRNSLRSTSARGGGGRGSMTEQLPPPQVPAGRSSVSSAGLSSLTAAAAAPSSSAASAGFAPGGSSGGVDRHGLSIHAGGSAHVRHSAPAGGAHLPAASPSASAAVVSARTGRGVGTFTTVHVRTTSGGSGEGAGGAVGFGGPRSSSGSSVPGGRYTAMQLLPPVPDVTSGTTGCGSTPAFAAKPKKGGAGGGGDDDTRVPLLGPSTSTASLAAATTSGGGGGGGDNVYVSLAEAAGTAAGGGGGRPSSAPSGVWEDAPSAGGFGDPTTPSAHVEHETADAALLSAELYRALYAQEVVYEEEPLLGYGDLEDSYPRFPDPADITLAPRERDMFVDLRPYSDPSPITVHVHAPLSRTWRLFRTLGLRHLLVVNDSHDVVGVITRHDLTTSALAERARELGIAYKPPA